MQRLAGPRDQLSLVENVGEYSSSCGYCDQDGDTSVSHGMWAHQLTVEAYQELLDRGWRRSGCWLYKPNQQRTCCTPYTIRLDVHQFQPNRTQRKVLRKVEAYLAGKPLHTAATTAPPPLSPPPQLQQAAGAAPQSFVALLKQQKDPDTEMSEVPAHTGPGGVIASVAAQQAEAAALEPPLSAADKRRKMRHPAMQQSHTLPSSSSSASCLQDAAARQLAGLVGTALQEALGRSDLASALRVQPVSARQQKKLPASVRYTCPSLFAVVAQAKKQGNTTSVPLPSALAEAVARSLNRRLSDGAGKLQIWHITADNGHLNFHAKGSDHTESTSTSKHATAGSAMRATQSAAEASVAASSLTFHTASSSDMGMRAMSIDSAQPSSSGAADGSFHSQGRLPPLRTLRGSSPEGRSPQGRSPGAHFEEGVTSFTPLRLPDAPPLQLASPRLESSTRHVQTQGAPSTSPVNQHPHRRGHKQNPTTRETGTDTAAGTGPAHPVLTVQPQGTAGTASQEHQHAPEHAVKWPPAIGIACDATTAAAQASLVPQRHTTLPQPSATAATLHNHPLSASCVQQCPPPTLPICHGPVPPTPTPTPVPCLPPAEQRQKTRPALVRSAATEASGPQRMEPGAPGSASPEAEQPSTSGRQQEAGRRRQLQVVMVRATPALIDLEFPLYHRYQVGHHGDAPGAVTRQQFKRFLVDSPLLPTDPAAYPPGACPASGFGSFHQQYWIDGKLIAVGVLDVLPRCLSSKYFFWDAEYASLSPGKYSALQEIGWVQAASRQCASLRYYYMGYYIPTCPKMRYKADYAPSHLLCPARPVWVPIQRVCAAVDAHHCCALSQQPGALQGLGPEHGVVDGVPREDLQVSEDMVGGTLLFVTNSAKEGRLLHFRRLLAAQALPQEMLDNLQKKLQAWHALVGPAAQRLVYLI